MLIGNKGKVSFLDLIILFLCIAVVAAILLPKIREDKNEKLEKLCQLRIKALTEAEFNYFRYAHAPKDTTVGKTSAPEKTQYPRYYTDNFDSLKPYLPEWAETLDITPYSPIDNKEFLFVVRDSLFFVIGSRSGTGYSVMGKYNWEAK